MTLINIVFCGVVVRDYDDAHNTKTNNECTHLILRLNCLKIISSIDPLTQNTNMTNSYKASTSTARAKCFLNKMKLKQAKSGIAKTFKQDPPPTFRAKNPKPKSTNPIPNFKKMPKTLLCYLLLLRCL